MAIDFKQIVEAVVQDKKEESLKRVISGVKNHLDRLKTNLKDYQDRKREFQVDKVFTKLNK